MGKPALYVFEVNIYDNAKAPRLTYKRGAFYICYTILPVFLRQFGLITMDRHAAKALISPSRLQAYPAFYLF